MTKTDIDFDSLYIEYFTSLKEVSFNDKKNAIGISFSFWKIKKVQLKKKKAHAGRRKCHELAYRWEGLRGNKGCFFFFSDTWATVISRPVWRREDPTPKSEEASCTSAGTLDEVIVVVGDVRNVLGCWGSSGNTAEYFWSESDTSW